MPRWTLSLVGLFFYTGHPIGSLLINMLYISAVTTVVIMYHRLGIINNKKFIIFIKNIKDLAIIMEIVARIYMASINPGRVVGEIYTSK